MAYTDLPLNQEQLDEEYRERSKYVDHSEPETPVVASESATSRSDPPEPFWDRERYAETARLLHDRFDESIRVLDAGCATGGFLAALRDQGFSDIRGLDPSFDATAIARSFYKLEADAASLADPPPGLGRFDLITLSHVLEHVEDLEGILQNVSHHLAVGGRLYVEVPNASRYADYVVSPFQDFNTEHINHFSPDSLISALSKFGFEPDLIDVNEIGCSPTDRYPVIYGIWSLRTEPTERQSRLRSSLANDLQRYVKASQIIYDDLIARIAEAVSGRPIVLWGVGQLAMKLIGDQKLCNLEVKAVVDGSPRKQGLVLGPHLVRNPEAVRDEPEAVIVVASILHEDGIIRQIRDVLDLKNEIVNLRP